MSTFTATLRRSPTAAPTLLIMFTAVCFGLVPVFARLLADEGVSAPAIALYRYGLSLVLFLPFFPLSREKRGSAAMLVFAGLVMGLGWTGYLRAIETAPVAAAGVVYMTYPLFAVVLARVLVGQPITPRALLAAAFVLGAALLALSPGSVAPESVPALLASLPAPIGFALVVVALSAMGGKLNMMERMATVVLGASAALLPLALVQESGTLLPGTGEGWLLAAGMALATATLPAMLYTFAAPRVGPSRSAVAGSIELPTMFAVGWLFFGESVGVSVALAGVLIVAAIFFTPAIRTGHDQPGAGQEGPCGRR